MNSVTVQSSMAEILKQFPGAQRALFRKYHIGGCSQCSFKPEETLEEVCKRHQQPDPLDVLKQIEESHVQDARILIEPADLQNKIKSGRPVRLLDIRSRQEFDAVNIQGSELMTQTSTQDIMAHWPPDDMLVIVDHQGRHGLDAASYFMGHGLKNVRCLRGGIDAWAQEVDGDLPRYKFG